MASEARQGASGAGAGAVALPPGELAGAPHIHHLSVSKNSRMHIGPQFVSVTQTVHNDTVLKGKVLGLVVEARTGAGGGGRRLRAAVAVFVCWAVLVGAALAAYVARVALATPRARLDLEGGAWRVVVAWARGTSRGERVACAAALVALVVLAVAAGVLAAPRAPPPAPDPAPHAWNITRRMWLAAPRDADEEPVRPPFLPLRLVVVAHTAGPECHRFADCAALMRNMQADYFKEHHYDLPYNFVVGNDARVYEGRGGGAVGAHTRGYNRCSLGVALTGNYRTGEGGSRVSDAQARRVQALLADAAAAGWLHARALVLGARDLVPTESPGDALYAELRTWPGAPPHPRHYRNRTCEDIYRELQALDDDDATHNATEPHTTPHGPH